MENRRYTVLVTDKVRKLILKLPPTIAPRIEKTLLELENEPRPSGCKKLKGRSGYCIRVSDYRIIYEIEDNVLRVVVIDLGHRRDVYR